MRVFTYLTPHSTGHVLIDRLRVIRPFNLTQDGFHLPLLFLFSSHTISPVGLDKLTYFLLPSFITHTKRTYLPASQTTVHPQAAVFS